MLPGCLDCTDDRNLGYVPVIRGYFLHVRVKSTVFEVMNTEGCTAVTQNSTINIQSKSVVSFHEYPGIGNFLFATNNPVNTVLEFIWSFICNADNFSNLSNINHKTF